MYKGKRVKRGVSRKKPALLVASLALLLSVSVMGTLAFLVATSGEVKNTFELAEVPITVVENGTGGTNEFDKVTKTNVRIQHAGDKDDADAYIRAAVVATWIKENGSGGYDVYGAAPEAGVDYSIAWGENTGWVEGNDGYFYYTSAIPARETAEKPGETGILIEECKPLKPAPAEGYTLSVEIIAQSIQADGMGTDDSGAKQPPVVLAWGEELVNGVNVGGSVLSVNDGGTLSIRSKEG